MEDDLPQSPLQSSPCKNVVVPIVISWPSGTTYTSGSNQATQVSSAQLQGP